MSSIASHLSEEFIILPMRATDRDGAVSELLLPLKQQNIIASSDGCLESILKRERRMSTGVGKGVALPHGLSPDLEDVALVVGISPGGIDFKAVDGALCHIFVLLVCPADEPEKHLKALGRISKLLSDSDLRSALMETQTTGQLLLTMEKWDAPNDAPL